MPVGPYSDLSSCEVAMRQRYTEASTATKVCGEMAARSKKTEGFMLTEAELADIEKTVGATRKSESADSFEDRRDDLLTAVRAYFTTNPTPTPPGEMAPYPYVMETFDDHVVVQYGDDALSFPYTLGTDGEPNLKKPTKVERTWVKATESELTESDEAGFEWKVTVIKPGVSKKGVNWTESALREATPLYERIPVGINGYEDHVEDRERVGDTSPEAQRRIVGWIEQVKFEAQRGITGVLKILPETTEQLRAALMARLRTGVAPGLSHVVRVAPVTESVVDGRKVQDVHRITSAEYVDIVLRPSAGGRMETLTASELAKKSTEGHSVTEATTQPKPDAKPGDQPKPDEKLVTESISVAEFRALEQRIAKSDAMTMLDRKLTAATALTAPVVTAIREKFAAMDRVFTEAEVDADLTSTRKLLDLFGAPAPTARVAITATEYDRTVDAVTESLFGVKITRDGDGNVTGQKLMTESISRAPSRRDSSIRHWYVKLTGDESISGRVPQNRLTESISSSTFSNVMGDSITRAMLAEYAQNGLDTWRAFASIVPARDFRTQRRERVGGYGNLPAVAQGGTYNALSSPGDEEVTYAITKRGGTEDLTIEAVANDDLGAIRRIPTKLARAAAQTLHEFVYDFMRTNATAYDGTALAATTRTTSNKGTTAFTASTLIAARLRMRKHQDFSNAKRLNLNPKFLVVPLDLEQAAYEVLNTEKKPATAENDLNFVRSFGLTPIVVNYWTDTNDWWLIADPSAIPVFELAFFNGQEDPELFLQDMPTVGNVFSADKLTWKIRHIYSGAPMDFRAYDGNIVP